MRKLLLSCGLSVFIISLIVTMPANLIQTLVDTRDFNLQKVSGSIWNGRASAGIINDTYFQDIKWQIKPINLFLAKLTINVSARPIEGSFSSQINIHLNNTVKIEDIFASIPIQNTHPTISKTGIRGQVTMDIKNLSFKDYSPVDVSGKIIIKNLYLPELSPGVIGDIEANIKSIDNGITADFRDLKGVLQLSGSLSLINNKTYILTGDVSARRGATPSIDQQLQMLGRPDSNGQRQFRLEGEL